MNFSISLTSTVDFWSLTLSWDYSVITQSTAAIIKSYSCVLSLLWNTILWSFIILSNILFSFIWLELILSFVILLSSLLISWNTWGISIITLPCGRSWAILWWLLIYSCLFINSCHNLTLFDWLNLYWTTSQWTFHSIHCVICAYSFSGFGSSLSWIICHPSLEYLFSLILVSLWLEIWLKSAISHI